MTKLHRGPIKGLPDSTLNECLFITAKRKAGKSYLQRLAFERALTKGLRTGWIDAMGIGWGITVQGDPADLEKPIGPGYDVVVFGGKHGHMPLSPTAGAALGLMLAKATFSWVLDISGFKSKAERVRFMAAFMDAIYENTASQLLLIVDEIDLWAPQTIMDKQGPVMQLLGTMDEIVRRGRIKGLVVWMATQRPAVVNKSIISMAEAMIAMKTLAPQDTEAVMSWMKFHLKKVDYLTWLARLPALHTGQGIVYLTEPEISITEQQFPLIHTLDTMSPRGAGDRQQSDKLGAKPDIAAITKELGDLEEKLKADDPAFLKSEVARLKSELAKKPAPAVAPSPTGAEMEAARQDGYGIGYQEGFQGGWTAGVTDGIKATKEFAVKTVSVMTQKLAEDLDKAKISPGNPPTDFPVPPMKAGKPKNRPKKTAPVANTADRVTYHIEGPPKTKTAIQITGRASAADRIIQSIAWWNAQGIPSPTRVMVAFVARYSPRSSGYEKQLSNLSSAGHITFPAPGCLALGDISVDIPDLGSPRDAVRAVLDLRMWRVLEPLLSGEAMSRSDLAAASNYSDRSSGYEKTLSQMRGLSVIDFPSSGMVRAAEWLL